MTFTIIAGLIQISEEKDLPMAVTVVLVHDMVLDFAEALGEGDLGFRRQVNIAEKDKLMVEEGLIDLREDLGRNRLGH